MKKKLFVVIYVVSVVFVLALLAFVIYTINSESLTAPSQEETADTSIGQYTERLNSSAANSDDTKTGVLLSIPILTTIASLVTKTEPPVDGCSLRFSLTALNKAVEPKENINYVANFSNKGKGICKNVTVSIYYTENEIYISSEPKPSASDYYWVVGDLTYGQTYKINLMTELKNFNQENLSSEACATSDNSPDICSYSVIFVERNTSEKKLNSTPIKLNETFLGSGFDKKEFGLWVWDTPLTMSSSYAEHIVSISKKNGFNVIYLSAADYIPIAAEPRGTSYAEQKTNYMKLLSTFITTTNASGISVDIIGGAKDWAIPENRWKGYALIDFLNEYNKVYPNAKVRNYQYDVEPYLLSNYTGDKEGVLREFVEFIDESVERTKDSTFGLSVVIPHFYDSEQEWTPAFDYNGQNAATFTHLLKILAKKESTSIIIMSYRNFFDGANGTKQISLVEIKEAAAGEYKTKIIVAQETGDVSPGYVTFYGLSRDDLRESLTEIGSYFGSYKNFGGVAVHYLDSFLKLK